MQGNNFLNIIAGIFWLLQHLLPVFLCAFFLSLDCVPCVADTAQTCTRHGLRMCARALSIA